MTVPGPAGQSFVMGWMQDHPLLCRDRLHRARDRARHLDVHRQQIRALGQVHARPSERGGAACCRPCSSTCFFATSRPAYVGHNPLAGSAYVAVFGLYFLAIGTGLVMRGAERGRRLAAAHWFASLRAALRRSPDRALDPPRRDVAAARLHRAPRLQRPAGGGTSRRTARSTRSSRATSGCRRHDLGPGPYRWKHRGRGR